MFWKCGKEGQNGVGIAVWEEWVSSVVRVMRASEIDGGQACSGG